MNLLASKVARGSRSTIWLLLVRVSVWMLAPTTFTNFLRWSALTFTLDMRALNSTEYRLILSARITMKQRTRSRRSGVRLRLNEWRRE